jgi:hypothetical protein
MNIQSGQIFSLVNCKAVDRCLDLSGGDNTSSEYLYIPPKIFSTHRSRQSSVISSIRAITRRLNTKLFVLWFADGLYCFQWVFDDKGNGQFSLKNVGVGKYLGLSGQAANGVKLEAIENEISWAIVPDDQQGCYRLVRPRVG